MSSLAGGMGGVGLRCLTWPRILLDGGLPSTTFEPLRLVPAETEDAGVPVSTAFEPFPLDAVGTDTLGVLMLFTAFPAGFHAGFLAGFLASFFGVFTGEGCGV